MKLTDNNKLRERERQLWLEIGQRLRLARRAALLSQEAMAQKLGVSRQRWSMYELGKRPVRTIHLVDACIITATNFDYLLGGDERGVARDVRSRMRQLRQHHGADNGA